MVFVAKSRSLTRERRRFGMTRERNSMTTTPNLHHIGTIVEIAGVASAVAGVVLSLHHWPAAAALIGGGVAYVIGKTLRGE